MSEADPFEDALIQNQALAEAIEIMSAIEDGLAATFSSAGASAFSELDALGTRLRSLQERFSPRLNTLGLFAAQFNEMLSRLERGEPAKPKDIEAAKHACADLESYYRQSSAALERLDRWVRADHADLAREVAALADALVAVRTILAHANAPQVDDSAKSAFRETVVQLLTATLEELKAPAVNTRRLGAVGDMLQRVLRKSAEKRLGDAADAALGEAIERSGALIDKARQLPGLDGFL